MYFKDSEPEPVLQSAEQALSRLTSRPTAGLKVIDQLPEATLLRIETASGKREVYSLLRNRAGDSPQPSAVLVLLP